MSELPDTSCTRSRILFLADAHVNKVDHLFIHFLTIIIIDIFNEYRSEIICIPITENVH